jgi:hypothetical protein
MSIAHLSELRAALAQGGWHVVAERLRGEDDVQGAAVWEVRRGDAGPVVFIDFAGFGGMGEDIPLEQSYGCKIRGDSNEGLYFRRIQRSRNLWLQDLAIFVDSLNAASGTRPDSAAGRPSQ